MSVILVKVNDQKETLAEMSKSLKMDSQGNTIVMALNILHAILSGKTVTPDILPSFVQRGSCDPVPYHCPQCNCPISLSTTQLNLTEG